MLKEWWASDGSLARRRVRPAMPRHRAALAAISALLALVSALGAALGPARHQWAHVRWPSAPAPAAPARTTELFFSPLLVSSHEPAALDVFWPCALRAQRDQLLFATAVAQDGVWSLQIRLSPTQLAIDVGTEQLVRAAWPPPSCERTHFGIVGGAWSFTYDSLPVSEGEVFPPIVGGFFSSFEPAAGGITAELETEAFSSVPSTRQWLLHALTFVFAAFAIVAIAGTPQHVRLRRPRFDRLDALTATGLGVLWGFGPQFYDDGWLMATTRGRLQSGTATNYFETWAATVPLGFVQHQLLTPFARLNAPFLAWRLVPLATCWITWRLLRRARREQSERERGERERGHDERGHDERFAELTLASVFLLFAYAWLMNLRPEPTVAALSAGVLVLTARYRRTRGAASLLFAVLCAAIATSMHPSGLLATAPLIAAIPTLWRDIRSGPTAALQIASAGAVGAAAGVAALFADSDVRLWQTNRDLFANDGFHNQGILDEPDRYHDLLTFGTHARLSSALLAAAVIAIAFARSVRSRRRPQAETIALTLAALLLGLAPTKWTFHFGSGAAIAILAIAVEASSLRNERDRVVRAAAGVLLTLVAFRSLLAKSDAQEFLVLNLPSTRWLALPAAGLIAAMILLRRERWAVPAISASIVVLTILLQIVDPLLTGPRWTMARRGLDDLVSGNCSLADQLDVTDPLATKPLEIIGSTRDKQSQPVAPPAEMPTVDTFSTEPAGSPTDFTTPWYSLVDAEQFVVAIAGRVNHFGNRLEAEWGARQGEQVNPTHTTPIEADRTVGGVSILSWLPWRELRVTPPDGATAVRFKATDINTDPGGFVSITAPTTAESKSLRAYLAGRQIVTNPVMQPHLLCADHAAIRGGIAQPPDMVIGVYYNVQVSEANYVGNETSPYYLAENSLPLRRVWAWLTDGEAVQLLVRDDTYRPWLEVPAEVRSAAG